MSEMIERVARAICQADEQNGGAPWDWYGSDKARSGYFDSARAAIEAMRIVGEPICEAGWSVTKKAYFFGEAGEPADPEEVWQAMIDAALSQSGK